MAEHDPKQINSLPITRKHSSRYSTYKLQRQKFYSHKIITLVLYLIQSAANFRCFFLQKCLLASLFFFIPAVFTLTRFPSPNTTKLQQPPPDLPDVRLTSLQFTLDVNVFLHFPHIHQVTVPFKNGELPKAYHIQINLFCQVFKTSHELSTAYQINRNLPLQSLSQSWEYLAMPIIPYLSFYLE